MRSKGQFGAVSGSGLLGRSTRHFFSRNLRFLYLVIAAAFLLARGNADVRSVMGNGSRGATDRYGSSIAHSVTDSTRVVHPVRRPANHHETGAVLTCRVMPVRRRSKSSDQHSLNVPDNRQIRATYDGEIITTCDVMAPVIVLSPTVARGPPGVGDQSSCLPGPGSSRSPWPLRIVALPSQFHVPNRRVLKFQAEGELL